MAKVLFPLAKHSSGYRASAVHFDGATNLTRNSLPVGLTAPATLLFSGWFKIAASGFPTMWSTYPDNNGMVCQGNVGSLNFLLSLTDGTHEDLIQPTIAYGSWINVLLAWDWTDQAKFKAYVNGIDATNVTVFNMTGPQDLVGETDFFCFDDGYDDFLTGDAADFYLAFNQWLDLTIAANRHKFISASGKPVDLGADGSTPTGVAPTIFFTGDHTTFGTNVGTGGAFTLTGSLTNASTSPSD